MHVQTKDCKSGLFFLAFFFLLTLTACGSDAPKTTPGLAWFLAQHEDLKSSYFVGRFGVDSHPSGWDHGAYLRAYVDMYEATHDVRLLEKLNELLKIVADGNDSLTGRVDDRTGRVMPGWSSRAYDYGPDGRSRYSEMLTNALFAYPLAAFARIVYENPGLRPAFGADAARYFQMVQDLYAAHQPFVPDPASPYPDGSEGAYFVYPENYYESGVSYAGVAAPINMTVIIAEPLIELYRASVARGEPVPEYRKTVERVGHYLWQNMRQKETPQGEPYLVWYYWPAAGELHEELHMEDLTHGVRAAEFAVSLYDAGLRSRWDKAKLRLLANTFTQGAVIGENTFANYIDGTGGVYNDDAATLYEWMSLEPYANHATGKTIEAYLTSAMRAEGTDEKYNIAVFARFYRYGGK